MGTKGSLHFLVLGELEHAAAECLRDSLAIVAASLACCTLPQAAGVQTALCQVETLESNKGVKVQMLQRPGPFRLRAFLHGVGNIKGSERVGCNAACEGHRHVEVAMATLLKFLRTSHKGSVSFTVLCHALQASPELDAVLKDAAALGAEVKFRILGPGDAEQVGDAYAHFRALSDALLQNECANTAFVLHDPPALASVCRAWQRDLLTAPTGTLTLALALGPSLTLRCDVAHSVLPLEPALAPARLCPCHGAPLAGGAAVGACALTGAPVRLASCREAEEVVQLGREHTLHFPPRQVPEAISRLRVDPEAVAPLSEGHLQLKCLLPASEISEAMTVGLPLLLLPSPTAEDEEANEGALAALVQELLGSAKVLVGSSQTDLEARRSTWCPETYVLLPVHGHVALLARRLASKEATLPPSVPPLPAKEDPEAAERVRAALSTLEPSGRAPAGAARLQPGADSILPSCALALRELVKESVLPPAPAVAPPKPQPPAAASKVAAGGPRGKGARGPKAGAAAAVQMGGALNGQQGTGPAPEQQQGLLPKRGLEQKADSGQGDQKGPNRLLKRVRALSIAVAK